MDHTIWKWNRIQHDHLAIGSVDDVNLTSGSFDNGIVRIAGGSYGGHAKHPAHRLISSKFFFRLVGWINL